MRQFNRSFITFVAIILILLAEVSYAAHMYYIGKINSLYGSQLVMDGKEYLMSRKVKVILRVVGSNGAIHEKIGRLSDVKVGDKITIKVSNGEVTELEIVVKR